jgi:glycerol-3-phosphate dehydrogenase
MQSLPGRGPLPERIDITIVGGGINGVALARKCAQAGRSVLLVERDDFASGATSRSTRIVHGGLRYLEEGKLGRLRESLQGRAALLREQPHLVQSLEFVFAAGPKSRYSAREIRTALWLYRKLGGLPPVSDGPEIEALRRTLDPAQHWALYPYQDAQCEFPERLVADWLRDACAAGAVARNHLAVLAICTAEGRVQGVRVRDSVTGEESYVNSEWVINATGPWVDLVRDLAGLAARSPLASSVRESHIMLRRWAGAPTIGLHASTTKGCPISIAPWNGMLQVGTTEASHSGDPSLAAPSAEEIGFLLSSANALFPQAGLTVADIAFSYAGVHPIPYCPGRSLRRIGSTADSHALHNHAAEGALGLLSIFGATLTTANSLARKTASTMGLHPPDSEPAPQSACEESSEVQNTLQQWASAVHASTGIPQESTQAIARWHGRHAMCIVHNAMHDPVLRMPIVDGRPQLVAQAVEAVAYEHALTLADILLRRVPMALDQDWSGDSTVQAASRIAPALSWSERRVKEEIQAFEEERSRFLHKPRNLKPDGVAA